MCVDFVTTCTPNFTRGWDIGLADIQTADLFTDLPAETSRTYRVISDDATEIKEGDSVFLRPTDDVVMVIRGRTRVGVIRQPPSSLTDRINGVGRGIATAIVTKLYRRSGDFDIRVS